MIITFVITKLKPNLENIKISIIPANSNIT